MGKFIDLTGKRFGRLTVIERIRKVGNEWLWLCQCDCGKTKEAKGVNLRSGKCRSCGCLKKESDNSPNTKNTIDMLGKTFGHLTVIDRDGSDQRGEAKWLCQCDCENKTIISVLGSNLRTGHTISCGCERMSRGEIKICNLLIENKIPFISEYKFSNLPKYRFDFYILKEPHYCIEYDGETHYPINLHGWHSKEQFLLQKERDNIKNNYCNENNIPLIRIPYTRFEELSIDDLLLNRTNFLVKGDYYDY